MSEKPQQIALFCDEAGKESDRYLAVGGLIVSSTDAPFIRANFERFRRTLNIRSEVKWNKLKGGNRDKYQSLVHYFFECVARGELRFHCILVDFQRFNHDLREDGGRNESLKRMYWQLLLHRLGKKHGQTCHLYAFPDKANELTGLDAMRQGLNAVLRRSHGCEGEPVKAIKFRDSETEPMLQLNDLILGGVCYQKNRRFEAEDAGQPKANLAGYILGRAGLLNYNLDTPVAVKDFTVWNLKSEHLKGGP
jgi:hypothetical protein